MRAVTATEKFRAVNEGQMSKAQFVREMRQQHPTVVSAFNGYDDTVQILKNKGLLFEAKAEKKQEIPDAYSKTQPLNYSINDLERGIRSELATLGVKDGAVPTRELYEKAKAKAKANLDKDRMHYLNLISGESSNVDKHTASVEVKRGEKQVDTFNGMKKADLREAKSRVIKNMVTKALAEIKSTYPEVSAELVREFYNSNKTAILTEKNTLSLFESFVAQKVQVSEKKKRKPDYLDFDKDGNKKESMKKALKDKEIDVKEDHSKNPNDKYVVRPCKNKKEPWAVWEGETRVKGFAEKKEAQAYADKQNKEQGLAEETLKEAMKKVIRAVLSEQTLNEQATHNLSKFSDAYGTQYQGVTPIINQLENIVTEVETFYAKTAEKLQGIFNSIGDLEDSEGLKIGSFIAPTIQASFEKDLAPVQAKGFTNNIQLPKTKTIQPGDLADQGLAEEEIEEKQTVFSPTR